MGKLYARVQAMFVTFDTTHKFYRFRRKNRHSILELCVIFFAFSYMKKDYQVTLGC